MPVIKALLLPPGSLFALFALGWLLRERKPRVARTLMWSAAVLLYALSTAAVSNALVRTLERDAGGPLDAAGAEAIVILAGDSDLFAPEYGGQSVGRSTLERVRYGASLYRRLGLPVLVTGGRARPGSRSAAELMREVLERDYEVPVTWVESVSRNTHENATLSAPLLADAGVGRALLVTHAWHMPRARRAFEAAGVVVTPAATGMVGPPPLEPGLLLPSAPALATSALALHEWVGRAWYELAYH